MSERVNIEAFIATDRLQAMARGEELPTQLSGAILVVDITGYTGSVEQAERQFGTVRGADLISKAINRIFDQLIHQIYRFGGVVVGFGGDALLAWYAADNGTQAIASAFAMQQAVATQSHLQLAPGFAIPFVIKASIAIGNVKRCIVGDPRIQSLELLMGEAMNRVALVQEVTKGSDIVVDEACALHLTGQLQIKRWITAPETDNLFAVVECLQGAASTIALPTLPTFPEQQLSPWLLSPVYENMLATQGQFTATIRQVVALFFKFHLPESLLAQHCSSEIDNYVRWVQHTLHRQSGYLIKLTIDNKGCYGLATFGAPDDNEDAPQRAVTAAMALRNPPSHLTFVDAIQIGISQGRMLAGSFGNHLRAGYDLLGHELTVANRLMARAAKGEILVTRQIVERSQRHFKFQLLGNEFVKGAQQPVDIYSLLSAHDELPFDISKATLGREAELIQLQQICGMLPNSGLQTVRLVGVPGVGKTQIVVELYRRAPQWEICALIADCERITQQVAYYPWRQIVQQLLCQDQHANNQECTFEQIEAAWLKQLGEHFDVETLRNAFADIWGHTHSNDEGQRPQKAHERQATIATLLITLLQDRLQAQPMAIIMEDVQWLDVPSFELLLNIKRTLAESPLLLLVTHRSANDSHSRRRMSTALEQVLDSREIEVKSFGNPASQEFIKKLLGGRASALLYTLLFAQTEGNPLALEEAVRTHQITGRIRHDNEQLQWVLSTQAMQELRQARCLKIDPHSGEWQLVANPPLAQADFGTPDQLQQMIFARFDLLNAELQLTLKVASVIGRSFSLALLQAAHPLRLARASLHTQLGKLQQHHFLTSQQTSDGVYYRFQHQLMQEGIYESMPQDQKLALHYAVGKGLETQASGETEQLAWHFWRCRDEHPGEALLYVKQAAKQAQNYSNHTALDFYNQACELAGQDAEILKGKVEVLHVLGLRQEERQLLDELTNIWKSEDTELYNKWGEYYEAVGEYKLAIDSLQTVKQSRHTSSDFLGEIRVLIQLGIIERRQGNYEYAQKLQEEAIHQLASPNVYSPPLSIKALNELAVIYRQFGNFSRAMDACEKALILCKESNNRRAQINALNTLGGVAHYQRKFADALTKYQQALTICRSIGDLSGEATTLYNLGIIEHETGNYQQAEDLYTQALKIQLIVQNQWEQINLFNALGTLSYQIGDFAEAEEKLVKGLELSKQIQDQAGEAACLCNLGQVKREQGDFQTATTLLTQGLKIALSLKDEFLVAMNQSHLAIVCLQLNQIKAANRYARRAMAIRHQLGVELYTTIDHTTIALACKQTGMKRTALIHVRKALKILAASDDSGPEFPERDYLICAQLLHELGKHAESDFALQRACHLVRERAEKIVSPQKRHSFLCNVPWNWQIVQSKPALFRHIL